MSQPVQIAISQSDIMDRQKRISTNFQSTAGNLRDFTPNHSYNTRYIARYYKTLQLNSPPAEALQFQNGSGDYNEENTFTINKSNNNYENSNESSSTTELSCFEDSLGDFLQFEKNSFCQSGTFIQIKGRMDFDGPPCPDIDNRRWIKQSAVVLLIVFVACYMNYVRVQINKINSDMESTRISDIVDARLDTLYKLSEIKNLVKDAQQSQNNFKFTIQKTIESEINKMYSDKTGRTDFALESAGGRIVQLAPGTENYDQPKSSLLGISLCDGMHGPRAMIQTGTSPGECWAFKGSSGGVLIKLLGSIKIDAVSLEHISKSISPTGDSTTAPKDFTVWGMKSVTDRGMLLGQFSYNLEGPLVQMFNLPKPTSETYDFVELRILSNHGNNDFTCIYRFRVHGVMNKKQ